MPVSYRDSIVTSIKTALEGIAISGGYNLDIGLVDASTLKAPHEIPADKFPAVFVVDTRETVVMGDQNSVEKTLNIVVVGYVKGGENKLADLRKLIADIEMAVCTDERRGGLAVRTLPVSIQTDEGMLENFGEVDFMFQILYYHAYGKPNAQE